MDRHRCKLCFRDFVNGKALGGHMRSHMMFLNAAKKSEKDQIFEENLQDSDDFQSVYSYSSTPTSSSEEGSEEAKGMLLSHESTRKQSSLLVQDGESETESSKKNPVCKRSKRVRKSRISGSFQVKKLNLGFEEQGQSNEHSSMVETEPLSSISETSPEEDVAHCLIMLSRDNWKRVGVEFQEKEYDFYSSDEEKVIKTSSSKVRGKYKCETCNKLFKSYQALGGHRTSHKKVKAGTVAAPPVDAAAVVAKEKKYECPFCDRVFKSGQAFGGHKRSHFVGAGAISSNRNVESVSRIGQSFKIDLNLPAPVDEEYDYEISQIEISAVSDALFVRIP